MELHCQNKVYIQLVQAGQHNLELWYSDVLFAVKHSSLRLLQVFFLLRSIHTSRLPAGTSTSHLRAEDKRTKWEKPVALPLQ